MSEKITTIYSGKPEDFNWIGFGSGKGTNLRECARKIKPKAIFTDNPKAKLLGLKEFNNVPKFYLDGDEYKGKSKAFNKHILEGLIDVEEQLGKSIDLIVLGGYMKIIREPLLSAYRDKIINVHPADLAIMDYYIGKAKVDIIDVKLHGNKGKEPVSAIRRYIGEDAVYDAIKAGETETKSSIIIVDKGTDHGEILTQGPSLEVSKDFHKMLLRNYADKHQSKQKEISDWPALTTALELIANGRLALGTEKRYFNEWRRVYVDEKPLSYNGYQVGGR
jgi:folate-dependent phosphoribosylglycinamide formyltransferase PurN